MIVEEKCVADFSVDIDEMKAILFKSLGNDNGVLFGFQPDKVKVYIDDDCTQRKAFIGIYQGKLCEEKDAYHAIIGL